VIRAAFTPVAAFGLAAALVGFTCGTRYPSIPAEEAAGEVLDIVGIEDGKSLFLSSGSEAVQFLSFGL
jgi:hypothetical protein